MGHGSSTQWVLSARRQALRGAPAVDSRFGLVKPGYSRSLTFQYAGAYLPRKTAEGEAEGDDPLTRTLAAKFPRSGSHRPPRLCCEAGTGGACDYKVIIWWPGSPVPRPRPEATPSSFFFFLPAMAQTAPTRGIGCSGRCKRGAQQRPAETVIATPAARSSPARSRRCRSTPSGPWIKRMADSMAQARSTRGC